jgi:hypothetical protein
VVSVNPRFGEIDDKSFGFLSRFESIRQPTDGVRLPLAVPFPRDFRSWAPEFRALVERRMGDDQSIFVIQVSHGSQAPLGLEQDL